MLGSRIIAFFTKITTGKTIKDTTSGMRAYDRNAIKEFVTNTSLTPEPDTMVYMLKKGLKIKEVQVEMKEREFGKSYLTPIKLMSVTLRVILIISSFIAFYLCITKIKKSQLKIENSVTWMLGCIILILMSIFPNVVVWISEKLGFVAPVNFIFLVMIAFLLMQIFIDNIHITSLNEKIKDLDHYIALKEKEEKYSNK